MLQAFYWLLCMLFCGQIRGSIQNNTGKTWSWTDVWLIEFPWDVLGKAVWSVLLSNRAHECASMGKWMFITILCLSDIAVPATKSNIMPLRLWLSDVLLVFRYKHFFCPVLREYKGSWCVGVTLFFYFFLDFVLNWMPEVKGTWNCSLNLTATLFSNSSNQDALFRSWKNLALFASLRYNAI